MPRRELKQRISESRAKRIFVLPNGSCFNRRLNNANEVKRMTDFLGHSYIFATLSLSLSQVLTASHTLLEIAGICARIYGFPWNEPREARLFFIPIRL